MVKKCSGVKYRHKHQVAHAVEYSVTGSCNILQQNIARRHETRAPGNYYKQPGQLCNEKWMKSLQSLQKSREQCGH